MKEDPAFGPHSIVACCIDLRKKRYYLPYLHTYLLHGAEPFLRSYGSYGN
jgi:hypothetical protein